ncbi:hypothetical protein M23134_04818 [Microscilla marina ATCC 23134]|uniref:Uncharacterized protein n=1 Tax=Microscilla marina ATCC 23134 TaxID=313606 RepID=A1ZRY0_MICM2|nr:hypothetical protein M23134_04818 [Microscilla marina ATCC 23134]
MLRFWGLIWNKQQPTFVKTLRHFNKHRLHKILPLNVNLLVG